MVYNLKSNLSLVDDFNIILFNLIVTANACKVSGFKTKCVLCGEGHHDNHDNVWFKQLFKFNYVRNSEIDIIWYYELLL